MERLADELSDEEIAKRWIVTSDPAEAVEAVRQYVDWGFNHVVFHAPGPRPGAVPRAVLRRRAARPARADLTVRIANAA